MSAEETGPSVENCRSELCPVISAVVQLGSRQVASCLSAGPDPCSALQRLLSQNECFPCSSV